MPVLSQTKGGSGSVVAGGVPREEWENRRNS